MTRVWRAGVRRNSFLVAADLVGFSDNLDDADELLLARNTLVNAAIKTPLFEEAAALGAIAGQLLGDEIRIAFAEDGVDPALLLNFLHSLLDTLHNKNLAIRLVVLKGVVHPAEREGCRFLDGLLPYAAQRWMAKKHLFVDRSFLANAGAYEVLSPVTRLDTWHQVSVDSEFGWRWH